MPQSLRKISGQKFQGPFPSPSMYRRRNSGPLEAELLTHPGGAPLIHPVVQGPRAPGPLRGAALHSFVQLPILGRRDHVPAGALSAHPTTLQTLPFLPTFRRPRSPPSPSRASASTFPGKHLRSSAPGLHSHQEAACRVLLTGAPCTRVHTHVRTRVPARTICMRFCTRSR